MKGEDGAAPEQGVAALLDQAADTAEPALEQTRGRDSAGERDFHSARDADAPAPRPAHPAANVAAAETRTATGGPTQPAVGEFALSGSANQSWRLEGDPAVARALPLQAAAPAVPPQHVAGQIALAIDAATSRSIEIRLDPPELGRVQIHLNTIDGGLQATVLAERPETHEFLRRHAETLMRDLGDAGYENVSLDFATGGQASPQEKDTAPARRVAFSEALSAEKALLQPLPAARRSVDGGLDIRL